MANCSKCAFWDQEGSPPPTHHRCLRYPPIKNWNGEETETQWPWTAPTDWCGEYQLKRSQSSRARGDE